MSSPPKEETDLKAGHAPATKAGGMRIKSPRAHEEKPTKEEAESPWETEGAKDQDTSTVIVSGVTTKGNKDFTTQAVKVAHEKPQPSYTKPVPPQTNRRIQQPR